MAGNKKSKSGSKKKKGGSKNTAASTVPVPILSVSLTDRSARAWPSSAAAAMKMSAIVELFKKHSPGAFEWEINNNIMIGKFASFFELLCSAVSEGKGPQFDLNWRWFDPNLFLCDLMKLEFGTVYWYLDVSAAHANAKLNLENIKTAYSALSTNEKVAILERSVIDPMDAFLAATSSNDAMDFEERGNLKRAEEQYQNALALDPHCLFALNNYADMLCASSQPAKAEICINKLLTLDPENAKVWGMRAICYEGTGQIDKAIECFEQARRIDHTSPTRLRNYVILLVEIKNYAYAKVLYEELILLEPRNGVVIGEYADLLHSMEMKTEAVAAFERALATRNVNSTVINDYAVLLRSIAMETGDKEMLRKARGLLDSIPNPSVFEMMNRMQF